MSSKNPPAFPRSAGDYNGSTAGNGAQDGMTLRDYFAAKAIVAVNENFAPDQGEDAIDWAHFIARNAYRVADAMLAAREQEGQQ